MRFTDKKTPGFYKGNKNCFEFTISHFIDRITRSKVFYVVVCHKTKDIRLNTLWIYKTFDTFELAVDFCETFDYKNYKCLGVDAI